MNIKHDLWHIDQFKEYTNNPRNHDANNAIERTAEAIKAFGFRLPVIVKSDGTVIDGHLRLKAARLLGLEKIPIMLADDLTDEQIKAFRISVNRMAELAGWDEDLLRAELKYLQGTEFDLNLLGFDLSEIQDLTEASFNPNYSPDFSSSEVTPNDFIVAQTKMDNALISGYEKKKFITMTCPHCAAAITLEKK